MPRPKSNYYFNDRGFRALQRVFERCSVASGGCDGCLVLNKCMKLWNGDVSSKVINSETLASICGELRKIKEEKK